MSDPNTVYKQRFHALTEQLGRIPNSRDREWELIHEEYKQSWQTPTRSSSVTVDGRSDLRKGNGDTSKQGESSARVEQRVSDGAAGEPTAAVNSPARESPPRPVLAPSRINEPARGPGGGLMAVCVDCGATWERPKARGRPSYRCGECKP